MIHRLSFDSHGAGARSSQSFQSVIRPQIREQIVNVPVLWFMEEIVEIVAGEVVCSARAGDRRQHTYLPW